MAFGMASQFSDDGQYFAHISTDGKLKIWNTISNNFEQEFTPDYHLTSPCTCLHFLPSNKNANNGATPRKKKRRESNTNLAPNLALGTSSGLLLVYSISKGDLEFTINSETSQNIACLSTVESNVVYSGAEQNVVVWNLQKRIIESKWKSGNEKISSILVIPDSNKIVTASKNIKLWDTDTKEILKTFTGHSSDVTFLKYVKPNHNADAYFISSSKGDRLLSCWNLGESLREKNSVASFLMEDIVQNISIVIGADGSTNMAATVRSGVVHLYQHTLNGKCGKPLKPKTTIQVVADSGQSQDLVSPIRIIGAIYRDDETLCIGHGTDLIITFENIGIKSFKKLECLVRKDPRLLSLSSDDDQKTKIRQPVVGNDVHYLTPQTTSASAIKRKNDGQMEVPMEKRLENLTLNKSDIAGVPKADNVAQLLVQGLHSKDKTILRTVLNKRDENIIKNSVKRLPITVLIPLLQELTNYVKGKTLSCQIGSLWLRHILQIHASILLSNPELPEIVGGALGSIQSRLALQMPLNRLKGRLDLLVSQVSPVPIQTDDSEVPLLIYNDKDSSDSDAEEMDLMDAHSESENEWVEESDVEEENDVENSDDNSCGQSDEST